METEKSGRLTAMNRSILLGFSLAMACWVSGYSLKKNAQSKDVVRYDGGVRFRYFVTGTNGSSWHYIHELDGGSNMTRLVNWPENQTLLSHFPSMTKSKNRNSVRFYGRENKMTIYVRPDNKP